MLVEDPHEKLAPQDLPKLQSNEDLATIAIENQKQCIENINLSAEKSLLDMVPNNIALHSVDTSSTLLHKLELGKDKNIHHNVTSIVFLEQCVKRHHVVSIVEEALNKSHIKDKHRTKVYQPKNPSLRACERQTQKVFV